MKYLLDTDMCSYIIKNVSFLRERFQKIKPEELLISSITWAELNSWVMMSPNPELRFLSLQKMFIFIPVIPFNYMDANCHGAIRKHLKSQGINIGALDMLIAAHAISRDLTLVTNNMKHFQQIPKLKIDNWLKD